MNEDHYKNLVEMLSNIQKTVNRGLKDQDDDRTIDQDHRVYTGGQIQEQNNKLGNLYLEFKELRSIVNKLPLKTQDRVEEVIAPVIETIDNLPEERKEALGKKRSFWMKFKNWWSGGFK